MEQTNKKGFGGFGIAMTYVGTVIGAGFASGQELFQFFGAFGIYGIVGTIIAGALFSFLGVVCMLTAKNLNAGEYEKVVSPNNALVKGAFNLVITFFSFGVMVIMFAGTGSLFATLTGLSPTIGAALMIIITVVVVLISSEATINSFSIVVPIMVVIGVIVAIIAFMNGTDSLMNAPMHIERAAAGNWIVAALLYVSFNTICAICVLAPMGYEARTRKDAKIGGILGGLTLGGLALFVVLGIVTNQTEMLTNDMPMYAVAVSINKYLGWAYAFMLLGAMFTTAAGLLFGLVERLESYENLPLVKNRRLVVLIIAVLGLLGSMVGFTTLVGTLYPATGYIGFLIIATLCYNYFKSSKARKEAGEVQENA